jgi:hypothetical protein
MPMPEDTPTPLVTAALLTLAVIFLLVGWYVAAGGAFAALGMAVSWWLWHRPGVE